MCRLYSSCGRAELMSTTATGVEGMRGSFEIVGSGSSYGGCMDQSHTGAPRDPAEFLRDAPMGMRVVIRYLLPDGRATDVIGFVSAFDETHVAVASMRGMESVALDTVIAAKEVP